MPCEMTQAEQLHEVVEKLKSEINRHKFCNLTFKFRNGKFYTFENQIIINGDELELVK